MMPSGTLTTLHPFMDGSEGANPYAGLIQGTDGNFYGTTYQGGAGGYYGTVFQITPSGTLTITTMRPCAHTSTAAVNNTNNEGREG